MNKFFIIINKYGIRRLYISVMSYKLFILNKHYVTNINCEANYI